MNILKLSSALAVSLVFASTAYAQLGAYGTVAVRRMTDIPFTQGTTSATNGSFDAVGATGGVYYDFRSVGPVRLGVDARGTIATSTQSAYTSYDAGGSRLNSGLAGVRAVFHTPFLPVKPYVEGLVGVARTNFGTQYNNTLVGPSGLTTQNGIQQSTHLEYDAVAGVDLAILPVLDFRVVELGYGAVEGNSHTYPIQSLSTGLVLHFPFPFGRK